MQPTLDPSALTAPSGTTTSSGRCVAILEAGSFRLLDCDRTFEHFVGRAHAEMRGLTIFDFLQPSGSSSIEALRRMLELKAGSGFRLAVQRPSGDVVEVELQVREYELQHRTAVHTVWRDLARSELDNQAVPHRSPRPNTLLNLVDRLIAAESFEQLAEAVHTIVGEQIGFSRVLVSRLQPEGDEPALLATYPERTSATSPSFYDRAALPGDELDPDSRDELTPVASANSEFELTVRDSRGEREGIQPPLPCRESRERSRIESPAGHRRGKLRCGRLRPTEPRALPGSRRVHPASSTRQDLRGYRHGLLRHARHSVGTCPSESNTCLPHALPTSRGPTSARFRTGPMANSRRLTTTRSRTRRARRSWVAVN